MIWKDFVKRWRMVDITRLGVPNSTVAEWRAGKKEPQKYHRDALQFWIEAKAGEKVEVPRHPEGESGKCSQLLRKPKVAVPEHPKKPVNETP